MPEKQAKGPITYSLEEGKVLMRKNKKPVHHESLLQRSCVKWFREIYPSYAKLLFAIPNGGKRMGVIGILMAEGVKAGVPDLLLAAARRECHGLFIEMKVHPNKPSEEQEDMIKSLKEQGYRVAICYTKDDFMNTITTYMYPTDKH